MAFDGRTFAQTHYFAEMERKRELNASVALPVALASAYAAAIAAITQTIRWPFDITEAAMLIGCMFKTGAWATGLYFVYRSYVGQSYRYVASADAVFTWRDQARIGGWTGRALDGATEEMLANEYARAAGDNAFANDRKSGYLNKANTALGLTLVFLLVTSVPWMLAKVSSKEQEGGPTSITMVTQGACRRQVGSETEGTAATSASAAKPTHQREPRSEGGAKAVNMPSRTCVGAD